MSEANFIQPHINNANLILERTDLMNELDSALKQYNHVSLIGPAGSGKTTLIYQFLQNSKDFSIHNTRYFYGFDLDLDSKKLDLLQNAIDDKRRPLLIIDEFDSIQSPKVLKEINYRLKEGRKYGAKTIVVGKNGLFSNDILNSNSHVINLNNWRLSKKEIVKLVNLYFPDTNLLLTKLETITSVLEGLGSSPSAVRMALELLQKGDYSPEKLKAIIETEINYSNKIITNSDKNLIVLPNPPKIITDLIIINQTILDKVSRDPKSIYGITPRQFEELVAELFEKQGHKVTITQQTQDGGKDLLIVENRLLGNFLCYVECKKYAPDNPVGVKVVRELFGTITADRATAGVIVTSSYFSQPAYTFTEKIRHQMNLIDYVKLSGLIEEFAKNNNRR